MIALIPGIAGALVVAGLLCVLAGLRPAPARPTARPGSKSRLAITPRRRIQVLLGLGLGVVGFPNMFTITGPGSPSVLTNMMVSIQQHVEWIGDCLAYLRENNLDAIEATLPAQDNWVEYVNMIASVTLFPTCNSWYLGANVPGKTRVFMPLLGYPPYEEMCTNVANNNYEGFELSAS